MHYPLLIGAVCLAALLSLADCTQPPQHVTQATGWSAHVD